MDGGFSPACWPLRGAERRLGALEQLDRTHRMDRNEFEATLRRDGFGPAEAKSIEAGRSVPEHVHPFDVCALVLGGDIT